MLHNSQFLQSAFSVFSLSLFFFFFNFFLATKVQTLVDFNDVPSEEKLPLVCEICVFIASLQCCLTIFFPPLPVYFRMMYIYVYETFSVWPLLLHIHNISQFTILVSSVPWESSIIAQAIVWEGNALQHISCIKIIMKPCSLLIIGTVQYTAICRTYLNVVKNVLGPFCNI